MDLTYQQVLAEVFDKNAKDTLVFQKEYQEDDVEEHTTHNYEAKEVEEPELFNKFQGNRGKPEHVIKPDGVDYLISSVKHSTRFRNNVINIDGKFRSLIVPSEIQTPSVSTSNSAFFAFRTARQYTNVSSIRVSSFEFSNSFYTFSELRKNTSFTIVDNSRTKFTVVIPDGNYTTNSIVTAINSSTLSIPGYHWSIRYISNLNKYQFFDTSIPPTPFNITFPITTNNPNNNGIGYNLGFQKNDYSDTVVNGPFLDSNNLAISGPIGASGIRLVSVGGNIGNTSVTGSTGVAFSVSAIQSDMCPDIIQDTYIFLKLQDWNVVEHHNSTQNSFQAFMKIPLNGQKNTVLYDNNSSNTTTREYIPQQPINVNLITISLIDAWGVLLQLLNSTFSITLEIKEVLDSQTYEKLLELNE